MVQLCRHIPLPFGRLIRHLLRPFAPPSLHYPLLMGILHLQHARSVHAHNRAKPTLSPVHSPTHPLSSLGITAGYHRLWSHRSYSAHPIFQLFLAAGGSGAVQGSIRWWARTHRIHHRYTDTELDPYNAEWGLWWTHLGWMLVKSPSFEEKVARATRERERECERQLGRGPDRSGEKMPLVQSEEPKEQKAKVRVARVDVSDLDRNWIVRAQHEHYFLLAFVFGALVPVCIVGVVWGRWREAIVWPGLVRLIFVHHVSFFRFRFVAFNYAHTVD